MAGRYRAPDEKAIRILLDRLDPRALARVSARVLLGPRPRGGRAAADGALGPSSGDGSPRPAASLAQEAAYLFSRYPLLVS
jgi:hypothetical protein